MRSRRATWRPISRRFGGSFPGPTLRPWFAPALEADRGQPVIRDTDWSTEMRGRFERCVDALPGSSNAFQKATAFFLFGSLQEFFPSTDLRSARLMMNGMLIAAGIDAVNISSARVPEFNDAMVGF